MHLCAVSSSWPAPARGHEIANRVIPRLLRMPVLHRLLSHRLMPAAFVGRKSGQRFATPVTSQETEGSVAFFSNARWWQNLRGGASVTLRLRGRDVAGYADPAEDRAAVIRAVRAYLDRYGVESAGRIGLDLSPDRMPTEGELWHAVREHVLVPVTIDDV